MSNSRPHLLCALALLTACGDGGTGPGNGGGPSVASVTVSPADVNVLVGATQQFSASATDSDGGSVTGVTVTWSSSDRSVATVTSAGLATGVAAGQATITATISGVSGSQVLTVDPHQCAGRQNVALLAGESRTYEATECILLPRGATGDRYRVAVIRPSDNANTNNVVTATVTATAIASAANAAAARSTPQAAGSPSAATGSPSAATPSQSLPGIDGTAFVESFELRRRTLRAHATLRQRELDMGFSSATLRDSRPMLAPGLRADPPATRQLNNSLTCSGSTTQHTLVAFNEDLAIYQDDATAAAQPFSPLSARFLLDYYTLYVKDMLTEFWGPMPDTDGNGRLLVTTSASIPNEGVAAVWQGDLQDASVCPGGNGAEITYYQASFFNRMAEDPPNWAPLGTIAHEAKHIVSLYNRLASGKGVHPTWMEEGTAGISEEMASRIAWAATGGPAVTATITGPDILSAVAANANRQTQEMWGIVERMTGIIIQLSTHPNGLTANPPGANQFHNFYDGTWHFHRFLADAYADAAGGQSGAFFAALNAQSAAPGMAGVTGQTGRDFEQLMIELNVAMSVQGTPAPTPARAFTSYDFPSATNIFVGPEILLPPGDYPWPVTTTSAGNTSATFASATYSGRMGLSGIRTHDFASAGTSSLQLEFDVVQPAKIVVTRIR